MKKKKHPLVTGVLCLLLCLTFTQKSPAQNTIILRVLFLDESSHNPLSQVKLCLEEIQLCAFSDSKGTIELSTIPMGIFTLVIELNDYQTKKIRIDFSKNQNLDLGTIYLSKEIFFSENENTILLNESDFLEDDVGGSENITGNLQSYKTIFAQTAAFNFSPARFKIRGYDSKENTISINGIPMNKLYDGRPQWSNWGGLNDVLRNQEIIETLNTPNTNFGLLGGSVNFNIKASEYRPGTNVSIANTNGSYQGRIMVSHISEKTKKNWTFISAASHRFAKNGFVEGTSYQSWAGLFTAEKEFHPNHSLQFTAISTPTARGKSSPNTEETFRIKGAKYNPYWGFQNGEIRNSRVQKVWEPILILSHYWKKSEKTSFQTSASYQFGFISNSRLGYANVQNPDPTYYQKLPSYFFRFPNDPNYESAYLALENLQNNGQMDWNQFYESNLTTQYANYYLYEDRNEDKTFHLKSTIQQQINSKIKTTYSIRFQNLTSLNYAKILDVFGENGFTDIDTYETGEAQQSNLKTPNRTVTTGDDFSYKYQLFSKIISAFSQIEIREKKWEGFMAAKITNQTLQRNGLYQNGNYAETSYGLSDKLNFTNFQFKSGMLFKLNGRNLINANAAYISRAPFIKNSFSNLRISNEKSPNSSNEKQFSGEVKYQYRSPNLKGTISVYHSQFTQGTETSFGYASGLFGDQADFIGQILTNIEKKHQGIEASLEWQATQTLKFYTVAAIGNYEYTNNPTFYIESTQFSAEEKEYGKTFLKNTKIGGSPQNAYSLGFQYRDPSYWWYSLNANYLHNNYLQTAPLLRTEKFYLDADGTPYINPETQKEVTKQEVESLLEQEKFDGVLLVNLVGGKSWKIRKSYLSLFASFSNVLNKTYKTGGFEQSRNASFPKLQADKNLDKPLFNPKYWFGFGSTYYLIVSYRF